MSNLEAQDVQDGTVVRGPDPDVITVEYKTLVKGPDGLPIEKIVSFSFDSKTVP
jgi:hypothetical protein